MNNFEQAQSNHDNAGPHYEDWNEPTDEHEEKAKAELADDPGALWDVLVESRFWKENVLALFFASELFRDEVSRENRKRIIERAQELADADAQTRADESAIDRWDGRNE